MGIAYQLPGLVPEGIFTHFAAADSLLPEDVAYTRRQFALFIQLRAALAAQGKYFRSHIAAIQPLPFYTLKCI